MMLRTPTEADLKDYIHQQCLKLPTGKEMLGALEGSSDTDDNPYGINHSSRSQAHTARDGKHAQELEKLAEQISKDQAEARPAEKRVKIDVSFEEAIKKIGQTPPHKKRRQPPLKIDLSFDEAMKKIVKARPIKKKRQSL